MGKTPLRPGENDLASQRADLLTEWDWTKNHPLDPSRIHANTSRKIWWRCSKAHSYASSGESRVSNGTGCPFCSNKAVLKGYNDLGTLAPDLASQWDENKNFPLRNSDVVPGSGKKVWWVCGHGHSWQATVVSRFRQGSNCPYCSGRFAIPGKTDLQTTRPDLAAQWHPVKNGELTPNKVKPSSTQKPWWLCERGHEWKASLGSRSAGNGCPYCSGLKVEPGVSDFGSLFPELLGEWDYEANQTDPPLVGRGSQRKYWWTCNLGHSYHASVANRTNGHGCPYCAGRLTLAGFNDLLSCSPEKAEDWNYEKNNLRPDQVTPFSNQKFWWVCKVGHEWEARPNSKAGCPSCKGRRVQPGFNDLATTHPELAVYWDTSKNMKKPSEVSKGSQEKVYWKCDEGHSWQTLISNRIAGKGCPYCASSLVWTGFNDLAFKYPELAKEFHASKNSPLTAEALLAGGHKKVWWLCGDGHEWKAAPIDRINGRGCPSCANYGYDPTQAAFFYFIEHHAFKASKVGITNAEVKYSRLEAFERNGWVRVVVIEEVDGSIIRELETRILRWIRKDLQLPPYLGQEEMGSTGGFSETFASDGVSQSKIIEKIESEFRGLRHNFGSNS